VFGSELASNYLDHYGLDGPLPAYHGESGCRPSSCFSHLAGGQEEETAGGQTGHHQVKNISNYLLFIS
jgi:hypothetical protein